MDWHSRMYHLTAEKDQELDSNFPYFIIFSKTGQNLFLKI